MVPDRGSRPRTCAPSTWMAYVKAANKSNYCAPHCWKSEIEPDGDEFKILVPVKDLASMVSRPTPRPKWPSPP